MKLSKSKLRNAVIDDHLGALLEAEKREGTSEFIKFFDAYLRCLRLTK
jgi:hypothetical protein